MRLLAVCQRTIGQQRDRCSVSGNNGLLDRGRSKTLAFATGDTLGGRVEMIKPGFLISSFADQTDNGEIWIDLYKSACVAGIIPPIRVPAAIIEFEEDHGIGGTEFADRNVSSQSACATRRQTIADHSEVAAGEIISERACCRKNRILALRPQGALSIGLHSGFER